MSSVVAALTAALQANPEDVPLRLHLASVLLASGDSAAALEQYAFVLTRHPAHLEALRGAAEAAEGAGEPARAEGYRRLHQALGGIGETPASPPEVEARKDPPLQ